jgi:hypothetical protein
MLGHARRTLTLGLLLLAVACGQKKEGDAPTAATTAEVPKDKGLTRDQFITVEIDSECARLSENAELDRIDEFREAALQKIGKTRLDRTLSLAKFMDDAATTQQIAAKVAECRKAAGWVLETGPEGSPTWVRSSK